MFEPSIPFRNFDRVPGLIRAYGHIDDGDDLVDDVHILITAKETVMQMIDNEECSNLHKEVHLLTQ